MEKNLKDMIKNLKEKTSKMLDVEPKSYDEEVEKPKKLVEKKPLQKKSEPKVEEKSERVKGQNKPNPLDDIEARIAKFYSEKEEKISALEKEESAKADTITKKISDSEYKSVISGIKVDTSEDEEEDNIGRRVLKEFALSTDDFEDNSDSIGMKSDKDESDASVDIDFSANKEEEALEPEEPIEDETFDTVVDIVSNSDPVDIIKLPKAPEEESVSDTKEKLASLVKTTSKKAEETKEEKAKKVELKPKTTAKTSKTQKASSKATTAKSDTKSKGKTTKKASSPKDKKEKSASEIEVAKKVETSAVALKSDEENQGNEAMENSVKNVALDKIEAVAKVREDSKQKASEAEVKDLPSQEPSKALYGSDEHVSENKTEFVSSIHSKEVEVGDKTLFAGVHNATPSSMVVPMGEDEALSEPEKYVRNVESIHTISGVESAYRPEQKKQMKVLFVVTECQPFVATGGLADVAGSLPKAIAKEGVDIRVIMPLYGAIKDIYRNDFEFVGNYTVHLSWRQEYCGLFRYVSDGVTYYFVDNERYFKRDNLYGYFDDGERFAYFCKAVVEGLPSLDFFPDIIHCNDWQSALVSTYLKTGSWNDDRYYHIKNIYTIHNVEYQGVYGMENLGDLFGVDMGHAHDLEYDGNINLTKGAIQLSDKVTTVSHSYCDNLKQPYCSRGLHHIIYRNEYKLSGIINGVDNEFYNPETDEVIACNYSIDNLDGKAKCKRAWQEELGLPIDPDTPLISMVTRLVSHKGLDLITRILEELVQDDIQFVIVGTGDQRFIDYFKYMEQKYPTKVRALVDKFSLEYARKNYAGSDIFLMPSKIEPCGISQMIASRYGTIPVVRETGGLKDSIKDFGCEGGGNGYTFANYNSEDLKYQVKRAISDYHNKEDWNKKMRTVMGINFGWERSAKEYVQLYESIM